MQHGQVHVGVCAGSSLIDQAWLRGESASALMAATASSASVVVVSGVAGESVAVVIEVSSP